MRAGRKEIQSLLGSMFLKAFKKKPNKKKELLDSLPEDVGETLEDFVNVIKKLYEMKIQKAENDDEKSRLMSELDTRMKNAEKEFKAEKKKQAKALEEKTKKRKQKQEKQINDGFPAVDLVNDA
jgi:hypothetical protein